MRIEFGETLCRDPNGCHTTYYWARPNFRREDLHDSGIYIWVLETFGREKSPLGKWWTSGNTYFFSAASDRTAFILRWA